MSNKKNLVGGHIEAENVDIGDKSTIINYHGNTIKLPKELTTKIPKLRKNEITGRNEELKELHNYLFNNQHVVLVKSLGGIGKTTIAQVYIGEYYEEYNHIVWISQVSEDIKSDFINSEGLLINLGIKKEEKDYKELWIETITRLRNIEDGPSLLIIDNAEESLSKLFDYLPNQPNWHILVTSREIIECFKIKELDFLTENEAIDLFFSHYKLKTITREEAKELINKIERHTLTIEILAKTANIQHLDINETKSALLNNLKTNAYIKHKGDKVGEITSYLSAIFNFSKLNNDEIWLMKQFAFIPPEFHSYSLLKEILVPLQNDSIANISETINELWSKGWLLKNQDTDTYKMHNIISDIVKTKYTIEVIEIMHLITNISKKLSTGTMDNPMNRASWISFGRKITESFPDSNDTSIALLQNNLGTVLKGFGEYYSAKELFEKALKICKINYSESHYFLTSVYSNLAITYKELGNYKKAKEILEIALKLIQKYHSNDSIAESILLSNYGNVLKYLGDLKGAKKVLERAVELSEKELPKDDPLILSNYSNLALVLQEYEDYEGAKLLLQKIVTSFRQTLGVDHPSTITSIANLASTYCNLGDIKNSIILFKEAIELSEKNIGSEHPHTARTYNNFSEAVEREGNLDMAILLMEKSIEIYEKSVGIEHFSTATSYVNLAILLSKKKVYDRSANLVKEAHRIFKQVLPKGHPSILSTTKLLNFINKNKT